MARQVLPIVGAVAGFVISGGNPMGAQIGFAAGSLIGNAVDPLEVKGNTIGDNPLQTASEGGARAIVFGKGCIRSTCILERGNRIVRKQRDQAGKGGGPVTINERVFWTFAIGLGEDLVGGSILRIWEGEKLVYDVTPSSTIPAESAEFAQKFRFYDGSETQLPDPDLETIHGVAEAPYYRGTAYVVFPNFDLTDYREAIPVYRWEVAALTAHSDVVTVYALGNTGPLIARAVASPDGITWPVTTNPRPSPVVGHAEATEGRFIVWSNFTAYTSDDDTVSFQTSSGDLGGVGGPREGGARGDLVLIAGGLSHPVLRSLDRGATFNPVPGSPGVSYIAVGASRSMGVNLSGNGYPGSADGGTWGSASPTGISVVGRCALEVDDEDVFYFGGTALGAPALAVSGGSSWSVQTLPTLTGTQIRCIGTGRLNGDKYVWFGTDDGQIVFRKNAGPWTLATDDLGAQANSCAFTGAAFLMGGGSSGDGVLKYSVDGDHWTPVTQPFTYMVDRLAASLPGLPQQLADPVPLSSIVAAIHQRCGHTSADYDVSELTDLVAGVVLEQSATGAEAINSIIGGYFADPSDYDGQIHYIKRGKPVLRTLSYDGLIDEPETTRRENAIEYPRKLHLFFQSSATAYAATKATSARSSPDLNAVVGEVSVAIPVTFDGPDEPAQIAAKLHKVNWTDAEGEIVWEITDKHLDLVPTDCVGLSLRGRVTRARITNVEDSPGIRKLTMLVDRQSAYTSDVTGIPLPTPTPPQSSILSPTVNAYMDIPALLDSHNLSYPIYYDGMSGQTEVWPGAVLQRSLDGGSTWTNVTATTLNAIIGILQETVMDASPYYTDTTNQVVVRLYMDDEIESISNTAFKSEGGAFALSWEDSGQRRWEIMQYRDAQQDSNGDWVLTTLHRGRLNTESVEHPPGSTFVFLDTAVRLVTAQSAWIYTDLTHRAVTNGLSPESATQETETFTAQAQIEWPVAHLFLEQDSDGDTTATVVPRNRFGTSLNPIRSITWTGYRWTVTDGSNTITREGTSETEVFDTSGWGPVTVSVSQLNLITGPGPSVSETIP